MALLDKILVANRGEIALRIIKSAKLLNIRTVAIYTESEKEAGYVMLADEKVSLGKYDQLTSFLDIDKIIQIAVSTGSSAIHPGYGFLSENPDFAKACEDHQLTFVGPDSKVLKLMGNKPASKALAAELGIPVIPSYKIDLPLSRLAFGQIEFPVLIKASFGGGGKGMKIVHNPEELTRQAVRSSRIALNYFGNGDLFAEQYLQIARHVEVQILGDQFGNIIHLYERECSIQRNHQKIIEEAPAIFLTPELRDNLLAAALKIGKSVGYMGAGTVEFLIDESGNYFFMEMNPRIQVEHAVTEQITGIDIVSEQLKIASGLPLSFSQEQVTVKGHAIEIRIYTENPAQDFSPSSKALLSVNLPKHNALRIEADLTGKQCVKNHFDPLLLKMIASGEERESAIKLLRSSISELNIIGPENNTKYLGMILAHPDYQHNHLSVEFCKINHKELISSSFENSKPVYLPYLIGFAIAKKYKGSAVNVVADPWEYLGYWRITAQTIPISIDGQILQIELLGKDRSNPSFVLNGTTIDFQTANESENNMDITINNIIKKIFYCFNDQGDLYSSLENIQYRVAFPGLLSNYAEIGYSSEIESIVDPGEIISPMHGKILEINITENQLIKKGDLMLVIESMKSENRILSHKDAKVKKIAVKVGAQVTDRMPLIFLED